MSTMTSNAFFGAAETSIRSLSHYKRSNSLKFSSCHSIYRAISHCRKLESVKRIRAYNLNSNFNEIKTKPANNERETDKFALNSSVVSDSLKCLEWPKLCKAVAAFAGTPLGKEALEDQLLSLHLSREQSEALLAETSAGIEFLNFYGNLDFSSQFTVEVKSATDRLGRGLIINGKEALAIAALLHFSNELNNTLKMAVKEDADWYMRFMPLTDMINDMFVNQALVQTILKLVDEEGLLKDDASSDLKRARNQVRILEQRLYGLMNSVLRNAHDESRSQEISYIDGRWCIRLATDKPTDFQGLLLWSGSGAEKYVEPVSAVPLNDELTRARALVSKAENQVLANLTEKILPLLDQIEGLLNSVVRLDVIISRAKYSLTYGGTKPILSFINTNGISTSEQCDAENWHSTDANISDDGDDWLLHLRNVYHPLLLQRHHANIQNIKGKISALAAQLRRTGVQEGNVSFREGLESRLKSLENMLARLESNCPVPIDILVRRKTKVLVLTGPNTGGKTAAIKTVGLAALMAKYGLYVLGAEPVRIPCFDFVLADIGDEQSLSQSLSTFSGHLHQIKRIRAQSTGLSLILLDEVGAGTNPLEGAALGMSVLESFADGGSLLTVATTHQGVLKTLKYSNDGFENACVEFDEENLRPTYKLLWGIPGRSNAISIAERLGLPAHILENARKLYGTASAEINKVIVDLERAKQDLREYLRSTECYLMQSRILYQRLMAVNEQILEYSALQIYRKTEEISAAAANARSALHRILRNFRKSRSKVAVPVIRSSENERTEVLAESSIDYLPGDNTDYLSECTKAHYLWELYIFDINFLQDTLYSFLTQTERFNIHIAYCICLFFVVIVYFMLYIYAYKFII